MTDWASVMPDVAKALLGDPNPRQSKSDKWRWGNKGSLSVDVERGQWFDFEADTGGGVLEFVERERQTDRKGAIQWLTDNGFIEDQKPIRRNLRRSKARTGQPIPKHRQGADRKRATTQTTPNVEYARRLWAESEPIGERAEHPVRRWAAFRSLLHPFCTIPDSLHYHAHKGFILAALYPIGQYGKVPECIHAVAIDQQGKQRAAWGDRDKTTWGNMSKSVLKFGHGKKGRVYICEGLADALALYSRYSGVVLSPLGVVSKIVNRPGVLEYLRGGEVVICCDLDKKPDGSNPGLEAGGKLQNILKGAGITSRLVKSYDQGKDPADETKARGFEQIDRYEFDEQAGKLLDGCNITEADRQAIIRLSKGEESETE